MRSYIEVDPLVRNKSVLESLEEPIVIRVNDFNENGVRLFEDAMQRAHRNPQPVIPVVVDSFGGEVYAALAMIDSIRFSKKPVVTISEGKSMSAGSFLLAFGTKGYRYAADNATILIHDMTSGAWGKTEELKTKAKHVSKLSKKYFEMLATQCGKPKNFLIKKLHDLGHTDLYLSSHQAKAMGLIDHIGIPDLILRVSAKYDFGLNVHRRGDK